MRQKQNYSLPSSTRPRQTAYEKLWHIGLNTIKELETEEGILASGRDEIYGCIFGRDSLITSLKLLRAYSIYGDPYFLSLVKKVLSTLVSLQGTGVVIESGEEPGKTIHEYRPSNHEHLTKHSVSPWYVYDDSTMRNYDSVDATPLFLIAVHRYMEAVGSPEAITEFLPAVYSALDWIFVYGDSDHDGFIDYRFHPERSSGGLKTQSWMDSSESVFFEDGAEDPAYPIAPVEVQAYTYAALKLWAEYFMDSYSARARLIDDKAESLKREFNTRFIAQDVLGLFVAFALDGNGRQLATPRSSMAHCLWAGVSGSDGKRTGILADEYVKPLVERLMKNDLFVSQAGIRTLSSESKHFQANSYHNGSIWPHDTSMIAEGLDDFGFNKEAIKVRKAMQKAIGYFRTPIELFVYDKTYGEYLSPTGQTACRKQAWSAAGILA